MARALYQEPQVLILDEATNSLDLATETAIFRALSRLELTLILVSHRIPSLRLCDVLHELGQEGQISASGTYEELFGDLC